MRQEQGTGDVASLTGQFARIFVFMALATLTALVSVRSGHAAPYAAIVVDARSGETLYTSNADARLHPASLTKMLTLYIAFDAIERGEVSLDTMVTVSKNAAAQPPSRLGLRAGQRIALRHLIRAAAVKSANDAASAIGDALSGSEAAFARRMDKTAKAIGMRNSTFKNANGLTRPGHLSTARDMNHLGRRLFYDFPQYYNIFSRRTADAGMAKVANTNRRFLDAYKGADGIKTGYTSAAGFNLTASAERGKKRIVATVFGGKSTAHRNARMAELMDIGFGSAPANARLRKPEPADIPAPGAPDLVASASQAPTTGAISNDGRSAGKTIRLVTSLKSSPRPRSRPSVADPSQAEAAAMAVLAMQDSIAGALAVATGAGDAPAAPPPSAPPVQVADAQPDAKPDARPAQVSPANAPVEAAPSGTLPAMFGTKPAPRPVQDGATLLADAGATPDTADVAKATATADATVVALLAPPVARPPAALAAGLAATKPRKAAKKNVPAELEVVTRVSTSGGRHWGINLGRFASRAVAERALMKTALAESAALNDGLRKVVERKSGYDANFMGLTQEQADLACRRLQARATQCFTIGP